MKDTPHTLILLRKHAKGELNDEERSALEALLREHPELREELEFTVALVRGTEKAERRRLFNMIEQAETRADAPGLFKSIKNRLLEAMANIFPATNYRKLAWATAVTVLLGAVGLWLFRQQPDPLQQFQQASYIKPLESDFRGEAAGNVISRAYDDFKTGHYEQSLALLNGVPENDSLYPHCLFLQGHNHYQLEHYDQAIEAFDHLNTYRGTVLNDQWPNPDNAGWTRILAMLSQYNLQKEESQKTALKQALQQFLSTANPADSYYEKAQNLQALLP